MSLCVRVVCVSLLSLRKCPRGRVMCVCGAWNGQLEPSIILLAHTR